MCSENYFSFLGRSCETGADGCTALSAIVFSAQAEGSGANNSSTAAKKKINYKKKKRGEDCSGWPVKGMGGLLGS